MIITASSSTATAAAPSAQSANATPAAASPAPGVATPGAAATDAATQGASAPAAAPGAAQPFSRWLGQADAALAQDAPLALPDGAVTNDAQLAADAKAPVATPADDAASTSDTASAQAQDTSMLAAMALPLMPLSPSQAAQALQAMLPVQGAGGKKDDARAGSSIASATGAPATAGATLLSMLPAGAQSASRAQQAGARDTQAGADMSADAPDAGGGSAALSLAAMPRDTQSATGTATAPVNAQAADVQDDAPGRAVATAASPAQTGATPAAAALAAVPVSNAPAADTVKLAGPPTAWRQSLQEALGDKMHVQVTNNVEQAVIRLEPPQLGRIDIAIRHSAGMLEVNITASNGEVLRQLQTVSDNLRSDLSQRQFTDVAVTVAPAPRQGNTSPFGDPQQQGRGRQQGRDQENEPGRGLAESDTVKSAFTLAGRE